MSETTDILQFEIVESKLDHLHGLELLYDKIKLNRSALSLDGKLQNEAHAMADKSFQTDMLRVKLKIDLLRLELVHETVTEWNTTKSIGQIQ